MAFVKGDKRINTDGRPKGAKNLLTRQKQAFVDTFYSAGGQARLAEECKDRDTFLMVARWVVGLLPKDIKIDSDGGLQVNLTLPRPNTESIVDMGVAQVVDAKPNDGKELDNVR